MKEMIDVAELLKDCPKGMELDCISYDGIVRFEELWGDSLYPIKISVECDGKFYYHSLTKHGKAVNTPYHKCIIFPKGKTTWEEFRKPFKDGDIITCNGAIAIFKEGGDEELIYTYAVTYSLSPFVLDINCPIYGKYIYENTNLATEKEKEILFDTIKKEGYKWNAETKTLEKLVEPRFKSGDIIIRKNHPMDGKFVITSVNKDSYSVDLKNYPIKFEDQNDYRLFNKPMFKVGDIVQYITDDTDRRKIVEIDTLRDMYYTDSYSINFENEDDWNLVSNKFDINTLKPFESKVLVRINSNYEWKPAIFGCFQEGSSYPFVVLGGICWAHCIPYEDNEHLLNTTNDCDEYYKIWEK